jgi:hypothetical protein
VFCPTVALLTALVCPVASADQSGDQLPASPPPSQRASESIDNGYVFIEGQYLSAPYVVAESDEGVAINGVLLKSELPRLSGSGRFGPPGWRGRGPAASFSGPSAGRMGFGPGSGSFVSGQARIVYRLKSDATLVAFEGRPLVTLDWSFPLLCYLAEREDHPDAFQQVLDSLPSDEDRFLWTSWLNDYRPPEDLLQRATAVVQIADAADKANQAQIDAVRRIDRYSYPLTVLGMVLAVLASGHLLHWLPARTEPGTDGPQPKLLRAAAISVALVLLLSAFDLAWTLLAAQAGQIRELNPLGSAMLDEPGRLIAFKSSATFVSCGLLLALRRFHIARLASWWLCLVLTILTFRWLAFNSLFLGS